MKLCFVTVGATAAFRKLLEQVLTSDFTKTLAGHGYTHLLVQYGKDGKELFDEFAANLEAHNGLTFGGFDFQPSIDGFMLQTVERKVYDRERGLIICHAGMTLRFLLCIKRILRMGCAKL
jgi:beta-1,4-N-acetylglucosaminyltransferase